MASFKDFYKRTKNFFVTRKPQPTSLIASGASKESWGLWRYISGRVPVKELEFYAYKDPVIFPAIELLAMSYLGHGWRIVPHDSKAGKLCVAAMAKKTFKPALLSAMENAIILGDGYEEIIWNGEAVAGYSTPDPKTIEPEWDDKGFPVQFKQTASGKTVKLKPEQMMHIKFRSMGDSFKGIGKIEPLVHILKMKREVESSFAERLHMLANPLWHISKDGATDNDIRKMEEKFKNINRRSFFATSEKYTIKLHGAEGKIPDIKPITDYILDQIAACLRIPKPILLQTGETTNRATLEYLMLQNYNEISYVQENILSPIIEDQLFSRVLDKANVTDAVPDLKWNPLISVERKKEIERAAKLTDLLAKAVDKGLLTQEEAKKLLEKEMKLTREEEYGKKDH